MKRSPTKSGFSESTGLGYSLEKIGDPGRGRKDEVSIAIAIGSLDQEVERIEKWAAKTVPKNLSSEISEYRKSSQSFREVLENFRTQDPARRAAEKVSRLYTSLWRRIEPY